MLDNGERLWRLVDVSRDALDDLPFGAIVIDHDGTILEYNAYESTMARRTAAQVVGANFFRDVAPCTAVQAFEGRLREFTKRDRMTSDTFEYFFPFAHGAVDVSITFLRLDKRRILIAVERIGATPA